MIEFPCNCGYGFSVPDELAGTLIQCPECKKLNDIPLLGDLQNLDESGIYKLDGNPKASQEPDRVAKLTEVYTREHFTDEGLPIDLRGPAGDPSLIGAPKPLGSAAPKYDPVSGELLEQIDVKPDTAPPPSTIPIARKAPAPLKTMVDGMDIPGPYEVFSIPGRLLKPGNLLVMLIILAAQFVGQMMMIPIGMRFLLLAPFWLLFHLLFISHFANVVDETGPSSRHELPTPLRNLDWSDDTFGPAVRAITAFAICYGPALLMVMNYNKKADAPIVFTLMGVLALIGTILFPAALLSTTTSGNLANARPDRLVGVMMRCGGEYVLCVLSWVIGFSAWIAGTFAVNWIGGASAPMSMIEPAPAYMTWYSSYAVLILGIYLLHFFCWHLGILYRRHHENFPWILQRHVGKKTIKPEDTAFPVQRPRRVRKAEAAQPARPMRVEPIPPDQNQP